MSGRTIAVIGVVVSGALLTVALFLGLRTRERSPADGVSKALDGPATKDRGGPPLRSQSVENDESNRERIPSDLESLPSRRGQPSRKAPWQRYLQGEDAVKAAEKENRLFELKVSREFEDALKLAEALAALRGKVQGVDHWQAANARSVVEAIRCVLRQTKETQASYAGIFALERQAGALVNKGHYKEAQPFLDKALAIRRKVLGEEHPDTATSYNNVAFTLNARGKYAEAEEGYRKALAIRRKVLGEEHPDTATSYNNVAFNLGSQGKYAKAEDGYRKALAISRKVLGEEHPETAQIYNNVAMNLNAQGKYAEAEEGLLKALAIRRKVMGEDHPSTATSYNSVAFNQQAQGKYAEAEQGFRKALAICRKMLGEEHPNTASSYNNVAYNLSAQGKYVEAESGYRKALAIFRKVLGEEHPDTARGYNNLAGNLGDQGKYAEAEQDLHKALAIRRKVLGEEHPDTATSYNNVASNLQAQGKYAEAEEDLRKALAICRKVLGEEHPDTARGYNNLASSLKAQGKYVEAEEGLHKALAIRRKMLGEEHPDTARSYNNLASNLDDQGKYVEAEEDYRKALAIWRKVLGEEHPDTARGYNNVAANLNAQGKYAEAESGCRKALAICRKVLGEEHPDTANSYNNLASNLDDQSKYAEAESGFRKTLAIFRKVLGEEHPDTATGYNNVAANLNAQGKYAEAESGCRKTLAICRKVLGEEHPDTANSYNNLAYNLHAQGKYAEAEASWLHAADSFAKARLRIAASGLDRATKTSESSPLPRLAAVLARNGKPDNAWQRFEEGLGRGTWDDLSARLRRPANEQAKQTELVNRLNRLDQLIEKTFTAKGDPAELKKRRENLLTQRRQSQDELDAFGRHLEKTYGPAAGQIFERKQIQAALPTDTALLGWLDLPGAAKAADPNGEHWVVLLRSSGDPIWVRLRGSGTQNAWTDADSKLPAELRAALQSPRGKWQPLAHRLGEQRLKPLAKHLDGVRKLIVLPATALAGVPIEIIAADYTVSYASSGTMYAHLRKQPKITTTRLLALADPVFDLPAATDKPLSLPPGGILLTMIAPGSNAARSGLKPNDVLLRYNGTALALPADLQALPDAKEANQRIAVTVWRDGRTFEKQLRPGKLGVVFATESAPKALAEQRKLDRRLASRGGDGDTWPQLPGTRVEVEALRRLFIESSPKLLMDSQASEQQLHELAKDGDLGKYRYLHLATHGEVDNRAPLRSAVILSRDNLPDPGKQLDAGLPVYDGQLTAAEVLRLWHLNSELVTLSACQTALGKYERGEGFVGFAQALILSGSRGVCLSLWKVDDAATALLMERFYQNLLGKREGLKQPLGKAAALAEAKAWLRGSSREAAVTRTAQLSNGVGRGKGRKMLPLLPAVPVAQVNATTDRPYAHPYFWAAFVLIGDPN